MKTVRKPLVLILAICLASQLFVTGLELNDSDEIAEETKGNPFSLMYDSNEKLAKNLENIQDLFMDRHSKNDTQPSLDNIGENTKRSISEDEIKNDGVTDEVLTLVRMGKVDEINCLDISDDLKEQIAQMNEDAKQDRFIVKYISESKGNLSRQITEEDDGANVQKSQRSGKMELLVLDKKVNPKDLADSLKRKGTSKDIEYIQPDFRMQYSTEGDDGSLELTVTGDDPAPSQLPDPLPSDSPDPLPSDSASPSASESSEVSPSPLPSVLPKNQVVVAVIDTGIDISHPGLLDNIWINSGDINGDGIDNDGNGYVDDVNGWNFYDNSDALFNSTKPMESAHGTHIAGIIISANQDNDVKIMPLKVFGSSGAYTSDIIDAIKYAEANGATIVNCSFGSTDNNPALKETMENSDMLFVCAVGNARSDLTAVPTYPACFDLDNVISVTATNSDGGLSYFSNYSSNLVDIAALGRDVNSALPNGEYGLQSGTSMSAAQVSGAAGAVLSLKNDLNATDLKTRLIHTADMLSNLQDEVRESRQLNLSNALADIEQTQIIQNSPTDDFDVNGYNPTQNELYQLYTGSGDNMQVSAGGNFTAVLKENGTVWTWGRNFFGECGNGSISQSMSLSQVIGLTNVTQIAAGTYHCLALKSDGTVWAWGYNYYGELGNGSYNYCSTLPVQVTGLSGVSKITAGYPFSAALRTDGTVWAWGRNGYGELGNGSYDWENTPVQVNITNVSQISAGAWHMLAIKSDGTVWGWGNNEYGQLGDGTYGNKNIPVQISGLTNVMQIATGRYHSLALLTDGTVKSWGLNEHGALGNGTWADSNIPVSVINLSGVTKITAGSEYSLAILSDGTVKSWGEGIYGALGDGFEADENIPVSVSNLTDAAQISAGNTHSVVLKTDGTLWSWGHNLFGQLGDGTATVVILPTQINALSGITDIATGYSFSAAVKSDGTLWTWGDNSFGTLGDGTWDDTSTPVQVSGLTGIVQVAGGMYHCLALKSDGTVWAWGYNYEGQLGDGTTYCSNTPVQVSGLTGIVKISAGWFHSMAVDSSGNVYTWGYNGYGELGDETTTDRLTPVQVSGLTDVIDVSGGISFSLALKSNGTVFAWGRNSRGQLGDGTCTDRSAPVQVSNLTDVTKIDAGYYHSVSLKSDGTVWSWGAGTSGELGDWMGEDSSVPVKMMANLSDVVDVSAGSQASLMAKLDGTVYVTGKNISGELGTYAGDLYFFAPEIVDTLTGIQQVSAGNYFFLALKSDNMVLSWGKDELGQLGQSRILFSTIPMQSQTDIASFCFADSSYTVQMPGAGTNTITVRAEGTDQYGDDIEYSLASAYTGVSIDSETGVVTVTPDAAEGAVQIQAVYGSLSCSATLYIVDGADLMLSAISGNEYNISLSASNISTFSGRTFTVTYDPDVLQITDLCAFTYEKELAAGEISGTDITIVSTSSGQVVFSVGKAIASGSQWSGVINIFQFEAVSSGNVEISVT